MKFFSDANRKQKSKWRFKILQYFRRSMPDTPLRELRPELFENEYEADSDDDSTSLGNSFFLTARLAMAVYHPFTSCTEQVNR